VEPLFRGNIVSSGDHREEVMPHCSDPYIEDPCFRDPLILNRYGIPVGHRNFNGRSNGKGGRLAVLGIAAILLIIGLAVGPFGWQFSKTVGTVADLAPTTTGQAR
jgi:hypothetical protein